MKDFTDIIGMKFGELTVLSIDEEVTKQKGGGDRWYKCECSCGNTKSIRRQSLRSGATKSCGHLYKTSNNNIPYFRKRIKMLEKYIEGNNLPIPA
jgi:hypothetical protein